MKIVPEAFVFVCLKLQKLALETLPSVNDLVPLRKETPSSSGCFLNYLFLVVLNLRCCSRAFASCSEPGATLCFAAQASHCGRFSC